MAERRPIRVVGGGLVGSLLAVFLRRHGETVTVHEARPDPRAASLVGGRSINLIVTERGIHALRQVGLWDAVSKITVAVTGRMLHDRAGNQVYQPYGKDDSECNYSVSRGALNNLLLSAAEAAGAELRFDQRLTRFDAAGHELHFESSAGERSSVDAALVIGADGAASKVRAGMMQRSGSVESIEMLEHGYKELEFPAVKHAEPEMDLHALHLWPRGEFMLMGLPNPDGSFTGTLYLPHRGPNSFATLTDATAVRAYFEREFSDAIPRLPDLTREILENPTGELGTVRCSPWQQDGRALLIGDAAHAIVPFFGQGMNAGFEDCTVLDELLERLDCDWGRTLPEYDAARKPNCDAIAEMALDNFVEMRERAGDPDFLLGKQIEHRLEQAFPSLYRSRYSMVIYSRIPYATAQQAGRIQAALLAGWCASVDDADDLDLDAARRAIGAELTPFLDAQGVSLEY